MKHWHILLALGITCAAIDTAFEIDFIERITSSTGVFAAFVTASLLIHVGAIYLSAESARRNLKAWTRIWLCAALLTTYSVFVTSLAQFANMENNATVATNHSEEIGELKAERAELSADIVVCRNFNKPSNCKEEKARVAEINKRLSQIRPTSKDEIGNTFEKVSEMIHLPAWVLLSVFMIGRALFLNILMCWFVHLAIQSKNGTLSGHVGHTGGSGDSKGSADKTGHEVKTPLDEGQKKAAIIEFARNHPEGRRLKKADRSSVQDAMNYKWGRGIKAASADKLITFMQEQLDKYENVTWLDRVKFWRKAA